MAIGILSAHGVELSSTIHHSDRGVQYTSADYIEDLHRHKMLISMTESGNPKYNAGAERINNTLKNELLKGYVIPRHPRSQGCNGIRHTILQQYAATPQHWDAHSCRGCLQGRTFQAWMEKLSGNCNRKTRSQWDAIKNFFVILHLSLCSVAFGLRPQSTPHKDRTRLVNHLWK